MKMTAREVQTLAGNPLPGDFEVQRGGSADNMTATMSMGDGGFMGFINPQSFRDGGPAWTCRYGNIEAIRFVVASLLEGYDYLLSEDITTSEAIRRLRLLRAGRAALAASKGGEHE